MQTELSLTSSGGKEAVAPTPPLPKPKPKAKTASIHPAREESTIFFGRGRETRPERCKGKTVDFKERNYTIY